jgi:hypothetical protein
VVQVVTDEQGVIVISPALGVVPVGVYEVSIHIFAFCPAGNELLVSAPPHIL